MLRSFIFICISLVFTKAEIIITKDIIYDTMNKTSKIIVKSVGSDIRYFTNNQTNQEKCQEIRRKYFNYTQHRNSTLFVENMKIKNLLYKHNLDSFTLINQQSPIKLNLYKLKRKSCSKEHFKLLKENEKNFKKLFNENKILHKLLVFNHIDFKTTIEYDDVDLEEEIKHKSAKEALRRQMAQ